VVTHGSLTELQDLSCGDRWCGTEKLKFCRTAKVLDEGGEYLKKLKWQPQSTISDA
jgi:hypothetical protein